MLTNLMIASLMAGSGAVCVDDLQSTRATDVQPVEISASRAGVASGHASEVEVLATVGADGRIARIAILDETASATVISAVERASSAWRFDPARACGQAVAQDVQFSVPVTATRFSRLRAPRAVGPEMSASNASYGGGKTRRLPHESF
ncbi:energy transducer TonB [Luteimonas sp. A478]